MSEGRLRSLCRRIAGRSYRRRRAEMWASVYRATFEVEDGAARERGPATADRGTRSDDGTADDGTPDAPRD